MYFCASGIEAEEEPATVDREDEAEDLLSDTSVAASLIDAVDSLKVVFEGEWNGLGGGGYE